MSQTLATALMNEILVARNALEACLISSAVLTSVSTTGAPVRSTSGAYTRRSASSANALLVPYTIRSGLSVSKTAAPSRRNSGLEATWTRSRRPIAPRAGVDAAGRLLAVDDLGQPLAGVGRDGGLLDQHQFVVGRAGDLDRDPLDETQVRAATGQRRRADADEHHLGVGDRLAEVGRERQPALAGDLLEEFGQVGLVEGHPARAQRVDLRPVVVEADDTVTEIGQAGRRDQPDVTDSDDGEVHQQVLGRERDREAGERRRRRARHRRGSSAEDSCPGTGDPDG